MSKLPDFLGPYRLTRFIRSGNSTQIYEAIKDDGNRYILKILRSQHWGNKEEIGFLKHEYAVAHKLDHRNVIHCYDFKTEGKIAYLVLEMFTDLNIKQVLRERGHETLLPNFPQIVEQGALALHHLHDKGWVHCDVKPDNFLLNEECELRLIDFAIARRIATGIGALFRKRGTVRGTRSYMSPEQIRNEALDARADVYSFGCLMYELLTGKVPYTGDSPNDLLNKHLKAPIPSVQTSNNNVTDEMADFIRHTMTKDKKLRPNSMAEILKAIKTFRTFKSALKAEQASSEAQGKSEES